VPSMVLNVLESYSTLFMTHLWCGCVAVVMEFYRPGTKSREAQPLAGVACNSGVSVRT
jgi:hypothetical protein